MIEPSLERRVVRKLYLNILPFLILCYIVSFLDRINVGFAALQMNADLGFSATVYGFGAGVFSLGYFVFEVPSNLMLHKLGARIWIARIMVSWGVVSACFMFVQGRDSFYVMRFLLGAMEAGFFPGIVFYLSRWFPHGRLGSAVSFFLVGLPLAVLIGAPISTAILSSTQHLGGLRNWQWMFLIEGALAVVMGGVVFLRLASVPSEATFLDAQERAWLVGTLAAEERAKEKLRHYSVAQTLRSPKVLLLAVTLFCNITGLFGITLWMPQFIRSLGGVSTTEAGLLTAAPYLVGAIAMVWNARSSERSGEVRFHILVPALIGAAGLGIAGMTTSVAIGLTAICVGAAGILASSIMFYPLPMQFLTGAAAATGIAFVNSISNLGGFVGPYLTGWAKDTFGNFAASMWVLAALLVVYGVVLFVFVTVMGGRPPASRASDDTRLPGGNARA